MNTVSRLLLLFALFCALPGCDPPEASHQEEKSENEPAAAEEKVAQEGSDEAEEGEAEEAAPADDGKDQDREGDDSADNEPFDASEKYAGPCKVTHKAYGLVESEIEYDYDGNGRVITRRETYRRKGEPEKRRVVLAWDGDGRKLSEVTYGEKGEELASLRFEYDDDGNQILKDSKSGEVEEKTITEYQDGKKSREVVKRVSDGTTSGITRFEYDDEGRVSKQLYDSGGTGQVDVVTTFEYDGPHRRKSTEVDEKGSIRRRKRWSYDDQGRVVEEIERLGNRDDQRVTKTEWGPHGKVKETVDRTGSGDVDIEHVWVWDEFGNLMSEERTAWSKSAHTQSSQYDYSCW